MTAVIAALEDLDMFVGILDDCGTVYGRRYRVALDRLRAAINTGPGETASGRKKSENMGNTGDRTLRGTVPGQNLGGLV